MSVSLISHLREGDLRQKGKSEEVVARVLKQPDLFSELLSVLSDENPAARMRAADAVEKITRTHPEWLQPYKKEFLNSYSHIEQKEVRWHLAQILPRLQLTAKQRQKVFDVLHEYIHDESRIVKTFAMQGLADIAQQDKNYMSQVIAIIECLMATGIPAIQSRGRKLLPKLKALV